MKITLLLTLIFPVLMANNTDPPTMPTFLQGTWKMENREMYEHWEITEEGNLRGFSYRIKDSVKEITEYLEIRHQIETVIYTATVPNQNEGKGIDFILNQPDSLTFSFENPEHDYPKKIIYLKRSDTEIYVQVSGDSHRGFSYVMKKISDGKSNLLMNFFRDITEVWQARPADSSFISNLEYKKGRERAIFAGCRNYIDIQKRESLCGV